MTEKNEVTESLNKQPTVGKIQLTEAEMIEVDSKKKPNLGTVYLSGKISPGAKSTYYRKEVAQRLRDAGFHTLDPMRGKFKKQVKSWGEFNPSELVQRDVQDVLRAKVVLAVIMKDGRRQSFGTPCEIAIAWWNHVPTVLVTDDKTLAGHPWTRHLCSRIFDNVDDALCYIIDYYGESELEI